MLTAKLHLILAAINFIGATASYLIWRKNDKRAAVMGNFSLFFTAFIFYHLCLALPYLLFNANLKIMALGYNLAILFLFLLVSPMYKVIFFNVLNIPSGKSKIYSLLFLLLGMAVFAIQSYDFQLPQIGPDGWVVWNNNFLAGLITLVFAASGPVVWMAIFLQSQPAKMDWREKSKAFLFTAGIFMFSLASIYFIARNPVMLLLAFIFTFMGTLLVNAVILVPQNKLAYEA